MPDRHARWRARRSGTPCLTAPLKEVDLHTSKSPKQEGLDGRQDPPGADGNLLGPPDKPRPNGEWQTEYARRSHSDLALKHRTRNRNRNRNVAARRAGGWATSEAPVSGSAAGSTPKIDYDYEHDYEHEHEGRLGSPPAAHRLGTRERRGHARGVDSERRLLRSFCPTRPCLTLRHRRTRRSGTPCLTALPSEAWRSSITPGACQARGALTYGALCWIATRSTGPLREVDLHTSKSPKQEGLDGRQDPPGADGNLFGPPDKPRPNGERQTAYACRSHSDLALKHRARNRNRNRNVAARRAGGWATSEASVSGSAAGSTPKIDYDYEHDYEYEGRLGSPPAAHRLGTRERRGHARGVDSERRLLRSFCPTRPCLTALPSERGGPASRPAPVRHGVPDLRSVVLDRLRGRQGH